jgi:hypothetical protein
MTTAKTRHTPGGGAIVTTSTVIDGMIRTTHEVFSFYPPKRRKRDAKTTDKLAAGLREDRLPP